MSASRLHRRQFLKLVGAASAVAVPTVLGCQMWEAGAGEFPPNLSPYAPSDEAAGASLRAAPILLLTNERSDNPFGAYLAEILRAEGLNSFRLARLSTVDRSRLERFALVLLAEGPLDTHSAEMLGDYVVGGGRLVAMRPDARLAVLLGVERLSGSTAEGYVRAEANHPVGRGMVGEALQFHGTADHYRLTKAQAVAWLAEKSGALTRYPAVTLVQSGKGQAALWAFDLARSVALTRQGNPEWVNRERDGLEGIRAHDAFVDWIDLDRISIPQADEQMRLLSRLITVMLSDVLPLPRLWYFPGAASGMLVATGDSHQNPASVIEEVLTRVEQRGGHMSVYYTPLVTSRWKRAVRQARWQVAAWPVVGNLLPSPGVAPTPTHVAEWRARGHEFALHPYVEDGLEIGWRRYWNAFTGLGYGPVPPTVRTHRILWQGWVETARLQAAYGLRMNLDYYHVGPSFQTRAGEWVFGHFTGSGLPMRFVDEQGRILNLYQQLTQLVDEHLLEASRGWGGKGWVGLSAEAAVEVSRALLGDSLKGAYSAVGAQFHIDAFAFGGSTADEAARWLEGTLDYAASKGIPVWSASEWLRFVEMRHGTVLDEIQWLPSTRRLSFQLTSAPVSNVELNVMVPLEHADARLDRVEVDGVVAAYHQREISGMSYGSVSIQTGTHQVVATYVPHKAGFTD